jgi:hypothetical protein
MEWLIELLGGVPASVFEQYKTDVFHATQANRVRVDARMDLESEARKTSFNFCQAQISRLANLAPKKQTKKQTKKRSKK